jgi:hypothetical protein
MTSDSYEREVQDQQVTVPEEHADEDCAVVTGGQVLKYTVVGADGTVDIDRLDGLQVEVVIPEGDF